MVHVNAAIANSATCIQVYIYTNLYIKQCSSYTQGNDVRNVECHFRVHVQQDNYVCFESVKYVSCYLGVDSKGKTCNVKTLTPADHDAQFSVRAEVCIQLTHMQIFH